MSMRLFGLRFSWFSSESSFAVGRAIFFARLAAIFFVLLTVQPGGELFKSAQAAGPTIPDVLKPWVGWVSEEIPSFGCAYLGASKACDWPGKLDLSVHDSGVSFALEVWRDTPGAVALPGRRGVWPQEVRVGNARVAVFGDEQPMVKLSAGHHVVSGRFFWTEIPEFIHVSRETGMISLQISGQRVDHPRVDGEGRLWLKEGQEGLVTEADSLRVATYRRIDDGVPLRITTNLELTVAGRAREVQLGKVLIDGARATQVSGALPVQIDAEGAASAFVRPGTHVVRIDAVIAEQEQTTLTVPEHASGFFEPQETWAWYPNEKLRSVTVDGLVAVDPARTTLPPEWRSGSTFLAEPGKSLNLQETRRGMADMPPNVLELRREIWFDLDGKGATSRDVLSGVMHRDWRLNYGESARLGRVAQDGTDLLITEIDGGVQGVELRDAQVNAVADVRIEQDPTKLQVVGWKHDISRLSATVHLPPGWSLLGGRGVDSMHGTWMSSWTLLDFFFVLIVAMGFAKLFGWRWGLVAALALCLSHNTVDAPRWIWVNLLITLALLRVISRGNTRRMIVVFRGLTLIFLGISLTMFVRMQIREATHPQAVDRYGYAQSSMPSVVRQEMAMPASAPARDGAEGYYEADYADAEAELEEKQLEFKPLARKSRAGEASKYSKYSSLQQIDPRAVVQTGPGVPTWQWQSWNLSWSGPVSANHEIKLWVISPLQNAFIIAVRITLLLLLALLVISRRDMFWRDPEPAEPKNPEKSPKSPKSPEKTEPSGKPKSPELGHALVLLAASLLAGSAFFSAPNVASAQEIPSTEVLNALKNRIATGEQCNGPCVTASRVEIDVEDLDFRLRADVHAQQTAGWALPGPEDPLRILEVRVDGRLTTELRRTPQGLLAVRLAPGAHTVEVRGKLMNRTIATIQFDPQTRPHLALFRSEDWTVDGIDPRGVPNSSLQLTRQIQEQPAAGQVVETQASRDLPAWYSVERNIALGLPWQIRTTITRVNADRPQSLRYPLLKGEAVISEGLRVEGGQVLLDFAREQRSVEFISEIPISSAVELRAPKEKPWTEVWQVECSRIWQCAFEGLAPVETVENGKYLPRWYPWPGESLQIAVNRPEGSEGQAMTVENVLYRVTPGKRLLQGTVELRIRSSRGDWLPVTLPEGAELQEVQLDGVGTSIRPRENVVNLAIQPGSQTYFLKWQQPWEHRFYETMPTLDIGSAAVNTTLEIHLSNDRWLLWVRGPGWGPAVLFWTHLVFLLIVAGLLGQWQLSPLRTYEWLLLAIGLAQLPTAALVPVVAFFILFQVRKKTVLESAWKFDLFQLTLVGLTLITVGCLYAAIHTNLLFDVDMQVAGAGSYNGMLRWYVDRTVATLPSAGVIALPIWVWRGLMLLWALWLSWRLIHWLPWAWRCFSEQAVWKPLQVLKSNPKHPRDDSHLRRTVVVRPPPQQAPMQQAPMQQAPTQPSEPKSEPPSDTDETDKKEKP